MATPYDNLPLPSANEYPYNLQGDQTKVRALAEAAQNGNASALQQLRSLGLNDQGGLTPNAIPLNPAPNDPPQPLIQPVPLPTEPLRPISTDTPIPAVVSRPIAANQAPASQQALAQRPQQAPLPALAPAAALRQPLNTVDDQNQVRQDRVRDVLLGLGDPSKRRAIEVLKPRVDAAREAHYQMLKRAANAPLAKIPSSGRGRPASRAPGRSLAMAPERIAAAADPQLRQLAPAGAGSSVPSPLNNLRSVQGDTPDRLTAPDNLTAPSRTLGGGPQISGSNSPAAPAAAPNYQSAVNPSSGRPQPQNQSFIDPKTKLQQDRLQLNREQFEASKQRYADQQAAAAARMQAQQNAKPGGGGSRGQHGGKPGQPQGGRGNPAKPKGRGGGGGGGGKRREPTAAELTRQMDRKNRAKERSDQKARDRGDDRSVHGKKDKWGRDYKDYGAGAFEQWQKDNEERRRKEDNERRAEAEKERRRKDKEPPQPNKPNPNPEAGIGADAMWDYYNNAISGRKMTHAHGNKYARLVRARGDLA